MDQSKNLESKYERLRKIGIGSYGVVFKCVDRRSGQIVAIKRYSENDTDPIIRKIAMREVRMLRQLRHPNLIHLIEVFRRKRRLHLVFDYCELTVLDVIEKYENNCPINLIKKIIWQLVNGVNYCHSHNCIHRDIKPENILINQSGVVKLCDFGFARSIPRNNGTEDDSGSNNGGSSSKPEAYLTQSSSPTDIQAAGSLTVAALQADLYGKENAPPKGSVSQSDRPTMTEYVATRWYRAPELLVGDVYYTTKIDIWAIGCVTAELMRGEPVWPGKTDFEQLCMISSSSGPLTSFQMQTLFTKRIYDQASIERLLSQSSPIAASLSGSAVPTDPIERKLPTRVGQLGIEFVLSCLQMDPLQRPTSEELLHHAYIHSARMAQFIKDAAIYSEKDSKIIATSRTTNRLVDTTATSSATATRPTNIPFSLLRTNPTLKSNSQSLMRLANHNSRGSINSHVSAIPTSKNMQAIYSNASQARSTSKVPVAGPKMGKKEPKYSASVAAASGGNQATGSPQTTAQMRYKKRKRDSLLLDKTKTTQDSRGGRI